ncbi:hypothetical protein J2W97_002478 [Paenibacillus jamilae]|uniref:hypothetical protein n=1 Tax=Paenibacillus polymyxa TaxID=1406 RepID=UPI000F89C361|nr:hypothetical protein [Paenibacillus polymyxa]MDP9676483.1 hypothetical protein [Paenibacillus jamilae]
MDSVSQLAGAGKRAYHQKQKAFGACGAWRPVFRQAEVIPMLLFRDRRLFGLGSPSIPDSPHKCSFLGCHSIEENTLIYTVAPYFCLLALV